MTATDNIVPGDLVVNRMGYRIHASQYPGAIGPENPLVGEMRNDGRTALVITVITVTPHFDEAFVFCESGLMGWVYCKYLTVHSKASPW